MIISKTPFRLGLFGGGTDLPEYANIHGGVVLNLTIDKYVYVTLHEKFESGVRLSYSSTENVTDRTKIKHPIVRNTLNFLDENRPLEITSISEILPKWGSIKSALTPFLNVCGLSVLFSIFLFFLVFDMTMIAV